ncbi:hypothetical protein ACRXCV_05330 [Halobacteriovorax sp. GFR7]|uniref:hypothetical protein n=1 Tax=unclassified Halobacteriovorax TaxID=2639665 RepID=UPI003D999C9C
MKYALLAFIALVVASNTSAIDYQRYKGGCEFTASYQDLFTEETIFEDKSISYRNNLVYTRAGLAPIDIYVTDRGFSSENAELSLFGYKYLSQHLKYRTDNSLMTYNVQLPFVDYRQSYAESDGKKFIVSMLKALVDEEYTRPLDEIDMLEETVEFSKMYSRQTLYSNYSYFVEGRNYTGFTTDHARGTVTMRYQLHYLPRVHNGASYHLYMRCYGYEEMKRVVRR